MKRGGPRDFRPNRRGNIKDFRPIKNFYHRNTEPDWRPKERE